MTEIYYIQNEKQYKQVLTRLFIEGEYIESANEIGIWGCDYYKPDINNEVYECSCDDCESDECILFTHIESEDKDVLNHTLIEDNLEFPAILVIADTYDNDEKVTLIPVIEAKGNSKYGINGYW